MATAVARQARRDLAAISEAAERAIDAQFARVATRVDPIVARHAVAGKITWEARRAILREVDGLLDTLYGPHRGAASPLGTIVSGHASVAFGTPTVREVERIAVLLVRERDLASVGAE